MDFRRKLMLFSSIIYCFFVYFFISSNICSDLVVDIPAKFLNTLQDIITSNRTPGIIEGFGLLEDFNRSQGEDSLVKKLVVERIRERNTCFNVKDASKSALEMIRRIIDDDLVAIYHLDSLIDPVKDVICMMSTSPEMIPKLKASKAFDYDLMGFYYSLKMNEEVWHRLKLTDIRLHQSGIVNSFPSPDHAIYCRAIMDETVKHEK